jgi:DNA-binding NarL/FixJ family response regulator
MIRPAKSSAMNLEASTVLPTGSLVNGHESSRPAARRRLPETPPTAESARLIRVAILSDSRLFCEGLRRILGADASLVVVGEARLSVVRGVIAATSPDILLADVQDDGVPLYREVRRDAARPWVILLSADADDDRAVRALGAGARGIVLKTASAEDLIKAIRVVHEGQIWASNTVMARVVEAFATRADETHATETLMAQRLSRREQEIVRHTASGLSNQEVADKLGISEATVKAHLTHVFVKLGVRDRAQLSALYHRRLSRDSKEIAG